MGSVTYPTLEHVAMEARPYPAHLLDGCETGLCLFAAAFLGHNDAIHMAEAGMVVMCVDTNGERLSEMEALYPSSWTFLTHDAWKFAETWTHKTPWWDVVSVDTFTGDAMLRSLTSLSLWTSLARKAVTVTITHDALALLDAYALPDGWKTSTFERASGVYWLVLEKMA